MSYNLNERQFPSKNENDMIDFKEYIHDIRTKSIEQIKPYIEKGNVRLGLEVGAGDGFQSRLLVNYLEKLVVTEYSKERLEQIPDEKIEYYICDAENLDDKLAFSSFDMIFSSHLLEHLPHAERFIQSCHRLIAEDGLIIHVVPSNWYAFFRLLFWYPAIIIRFKKKRRRKKSFNLMSKPESIADNNQKMEHKTRIKLFEYLFPRPHGISNNILGEYFSMRRKAWTKLFKENGLGVITIMNGSCFSGYGFGYEKSKKLLSRLGIACEYIFILQRKSND